MDINLLHNMYDAMPELWYIIGFLIFLLIFLSLVLTFYLLKMKQKNYFLQRDRERYAETLYASHDGYFAFIYPDDKVNDPRQTITERCSRRLAVILGLEKGIKSDFNEILKNFYKDDIKKINKYVGLLKEEGVAFEDYFLLKTANKYIRLEGVRINGADGNIYCDMIWFRDVSFATNRIKNLEKEKQSLENRFRQQQDLLDNLPFAVWLRDEKLNIVYCNKKYVDLVAEKTKEDIISEKIELVGTNGDSISRSIAEKAHKSKRLNKTTANIAVKGNRIAMEAFETPFYGENSLDKTFSAGCLINISELDELKRNLKRHQDAQLEILGMLGTAFVVFNQDMILQYHNQAFIDLWNLEPEWISQRPCYLAFLDILREKRMLPEVPDYKAFRQEEQCKFAQIIEPTSDLLHIPNGKTLRRMRAPHPMGGLVLAFEDISDRLAATSSYNALIAVQNDILKGLFEGVLIFGTNERLVFFNDAYIKLWNADTVFLSGEPSFDEVLDSQREFFAKDEDWSRLRLAIKANILDVTSKTMILQRTNFPPLQLGVTRLSDGNILITYEEIN
ncbi:MAG: PAS domain-containing protein [Alphaproteobacteria bacterium]|nr:PAS domain-containing protein [Alphaproteobacteria bacterium]